MNTEDLKITDYRAKLIKNELRKWATDTVTSSLENIWKLIPWEDELNEVVHMDTARSVLFSFLGKHPDFNLGKIVCQDAEECNLFKEFIEEKLAIIINWHNDFIVRAENILKYYAVIEERIIANSGIGNVYKHIEQIYGKTRYDVISKVYEKYATDVNNGKFFDAMYTGNLINLKGELFAHLVG